MAEKISIINKNDERLLKIELARILNRSGYEQKQIASLLNITQPMVSIYIIIQREGSCKNKINCRSCF
jgi:predicted transcriptional regulator